LVAYAHALFLNGSATCEAQFSIGPFPVTIAYTKKPKLENIASRPFLSSFTFNSEKASGSSARPKGSKDSPGYKGSKPSPAGPPFIL